MTAQTDPASPGKAPPAATTILVVDDEPANLALMDQIIQPHFRVRAVLTGEQALRIAATAPRPDLILLDVMMPEMDGYAVLDRLRQSPESRDIPVIFVTAMNAEEDECKGLELGAADYITKPINPSIVLARVRAQLELKATRDLLADQNALLEGQIAKRTEDIKRALGLAEAANAALRKTYFGTLMAIFRVVELRGSLIGEHSRRVAELARRVTQSMGMDEQEAQDIFVAALLHDIGKLGFSEELLRKPASAMKGIELARYQRHPALGADALGSIEALAGIASIVRAHHERYDGSGFPKGLSGLGIPLGARIIGAVSDYDDLRYGVLTSRPMSVRDSHRFMIEGRGHRFDPEVIDLLEPLLEIGDPNEIEEIRVKAVHLQDGMLLTRDVFHPDGFMLISKGTVLERRTIDHLSAVQKDSAVALEIFVERQRRRS